MDQPITFQNSKGDKLAGLIRQTNDQKHILIMAHGFSSNKNTVNFVRLADKLESQGIATFRFDFYGHGESEGKFEDITITEAVDDILQAIKFVQSLGYAEIGLLGSSFGGGASILAASKLPIGLNFLCLKSPASDYVAIETGKYSKADLEHWKHLGSTDYVDNNKHLKLNYTFIDDVYRHDIYTAAKTITIPTLIVHGDHDDDVSYAQSQKLVTCLPNATLTTIHGADHRYTTETHAQEILTAFFDFTLNHFRETPGS